MQFSHKRITTYIIAFSLLCVTYGVFFNTTYNCDAIQAYDGPFGIGYGFRELCIERLGNGRIVTIIPYVIYRLLWYISVSYFSNQWVIQILSFAVLDLGLMICTEVFGYKYFPFMLIGVISPAFVEIFAFSGLEQPMAFVFTALALQLFSKRKLWGAGFFVLMAISTYQSYAMVFAVMALAYIYIQCGHESQRRRLVLYITGYFITGVAALLNIMGTKVICILASLPEVKHTTTTYDWAFIKLRTIEIWQEYVAVLRNGYSYYPCNGILVLLFLFVFATIIMLAVEKNIMKLVEYVMVVGVMVITPIVFCYVTAYVYLPQRTLFSFYMAVGLIVAMSISEVQIEKIWKSEIALVLFFLLISINRVQTGAMDFSICNKLELYQANQIVRYINNYEESSGMTIDTIKVMKVPVGTQLFEQEYLNIFSERGSISQHMLGTPWSDVELISFVSGKEYLRENMTEEELNRMFPTFNRAMTDTLSEANHLRTENNVLYWITIG